MSKVEFSMSTLKRDALAGTVTGLMAIPLSVGICLMSEFPVQVGLATVVAACFISFISYLFKPGNHIGVPGVAAGLAPVLALGVHRFGMENMPWLIFLTGAMQMIVWRYRLEGFILKAVPHFLIEGLLAGVGLKIAMKFVPYTYEAVGTSTVFWSSERLTVVLASAAAFVLFLHLYKKFKDSMPGLPYIAIIAGGIWISLYVDFPMLKLDDYAFKVRSPLADFTAS